MLSLPKSLPTPKVSPDLGSIRSQKDPSHPQKEATLGFQDAKPEIQRSTPLELEHCSSIRVDVYGD